MKLNSIAMVLVLVGVALAGYFAYSAWSSWEATSKEAATLMADEAASADAVDEAVVLSQSYLRDLVVFGDAVLFGLVFLLFLSRAPRGIAYGLLVLPVIMTVFLIVIMPVTSLGVTGVIAAFLTFDAAGSLTLVDSYRSA